MRGHVHDAEIMQEVLPPDMVGNGALGFMIALIALRAAMRPILRDIAVNSSIARDPWLAAVGDFLATLGMTKARRFQEQVFHGRARSAIFSSRCARA